MTNENNDDGFSIDSFKDALFKIPDESWNEFYKIVDEENKHREDKINEKARAAAISVVEGFGLTIGDVFKLADDNKNKKDGISINSVLVRIRKKLGDKSEQGLFNPSVKEDEQLYNKPKDSEKWVRISKAPWLKTELENLCEANSSVSSDDLDILIKKYTSQEK
jgi:hypothetical protein